MKKFKFKWKTGKKFIDKRGFVKKLLMEIFPLV